MGSSFFCANTLRAGLWGTVLAIFLHCIDGKTEAWKEVTNCLFQVTLHVRGKGTLEPRIFAFSPSGKCAEMRGEFMYKRREFNWSPS